MANSPDCTCWDYENPDCTGKCTSSRALIANWATATIWRFHCDPDNYRNITVYGPSGHATSWAGRALSPIELGEFIDTLAAPEAKRLLKVDRILIGNERLARKCREIECDHCHDGSK